MTWKPSHDDSGGSASPYDDAVGQLERRPLHLALVGFNRLSHLPALVVALILLGMAGLTAILWMRATGMAWAGWGAGGLGVLFAIADWVFLWLLPRRNISYGPIEPSLLALAVLRWVISWGGLLVAWAGLRPGAALAWLGGLYVAISVLSVYSTAVEPFRLTVTQESHLSLKLDGCLPPVRVLQVGDLHIERLTRREAELLDRIAALTPDLIVLTGDYLNLSYVHDPVALQEARKFLRQLRAPFGVYAVSGSPPVDPPAIVARLFEGLDNIRLLQNEHVTLAVRGQRICLAGLICSHDLVTDSARLQASLVGAPQDVLTLALYHSPDLMPAMVEAGVDLYLAGHTHGGQIRLPVYGAVITSSQYGKRYEMGHYREGNTHLYVSRGVGMEGMGAPRARFLCPPEIVMWTLRGKT